ncbi:MAG: hypothetical protein SFW08_05670 [Gemmatimonadaceae bacterium]|nr:hypothetical protein [Gemmatimonadaceae bacterium]
MAARSHAAPFSDHLREAIALNRERLGQWSALSQGRTRAVSRLLIASEYATLPVAWWTERAAQRAGAAAVAALAACFVPMRNLPPIQRSAPVDAPHSLLQARRSATAAWAGAISAATRADAPQDAHAATATMLRTLAAAPGTLCMRRHLAESAARVACVLRSLNAREPARAILWALLERHALGIRFADVLDDLALPLQRDGIPILAHDLPPIPWEL